MICCKHHWCKRIVAVMVAAYSLISLSGCASLPGKTNQEKRAKAGGHSYDTVEKKRIAGGDAATKHKILSPLLRQFYGDRVKRLEMVREKYGIKIDSMAYRVVKANPKKKSSVEEKIRAGRKATAFKAVIPTQFGSGVVRLTPKAHDFFREVVRAYKADGIRRVLIVGHADSVGSASSNLRLSEHRAIAVARVFVEEGYPASYVYYEGAGESEPVADNATLEGRARNRRVEVFDASSFRGLALARRQSNAGKRASFKVYGAILPFHGKPYRAQRLLAHGRQVSEARGKNGIRNLLDSITAKVKETFTAHAESFPQIPAFMDDSFVKKKVSMRQGVEKNFIFRPLDHMLGYYNKSLFARLDGGAFLAIQPVSILKEHVISVKRPALLVWKKLRGRHASPDFRITGMAWLYEGTGKMLYRWRAENADARRYGILGLDVLLPEFEGQVLDVKRERQLAAQFYYMHAGRLHVARVPLRIRLSPVERKTGVFEILKHAWTPGVN